MNAQIKPNYYVEINCGGGYTRTVPCDTIEEIETIKGSGANIKHVVIHTAVILDPTKSIQESLISNIR